MPAERAPGGPPVYKRRGTLRGNQPWLYLAYNNMWYVGNTKYKDTRHAGGWACTAAPVADGTLPTEAPEGGWKVYNGERFIVQRSVKVQ